MGKTYDAYGDALKVLFLMYLKFFFTQIYNAQILCKFSKDRARLEIQPHFDT